MFYIFILTLASDEYKFEWGVRKTPNTQVIVCTPWEKQKKKVG